MHNQHTPRRPDGFAKYRARHYRDAAKQLATRRSRPGHAFTWESALTGPGGGALPDR
jgi:hypothetical protein